MINVASSWARPPLVESSPGRFRVAALRSAQVSLFGTTRRASVRSLAECLDIGQILAACRRALVDEERVASKKRHHSPAYRMIHVTLPCRCETGNASDGRHEIDAVWRESELDDAVRPLKICELKSEGRRGRSEYGERTPHALRVARIGIDPDVDILRTARNTVYGQRYSDGHAWQGGSTRRGCSYSLGNGMALMRRGHGYQPHKTLLRAIGYYREDTERSRQISLKRSVT